MAFVSFPAMTLVFAAAPTAVPVVFGHHWRAAVPTMQILAIAGLVSSIQHLVRPVLYAAGRQATALRLQSALTVTSVGAFALGLHWGIAGVATAVAVVLWCFSPVLVHYAGREARVSLRDYARTLRPAAVSCVALLAGFKVVSRAAAAAGAPVVVDLVASAACAGAAYVLCLRLLWPTDLAEGLHSVKLFLRPGALATALGRGGGRGRPDGALPADEPVVSPGR
jgi:PST family polysaccharide transporter